MKKSFFILYVLLITGGAHGAASSSGSSRLKGMVTPAQIREEFGSTEDYPKSIRAAAQETQYPFDMTGILERFSAAQKALSETPLTGEISRLSRFLSQTQDKLQKPDERLSAIGTLKDAEENIKELNTFYTGKDMRIFNSGKSYPVASILDPISLKLSQELIKMSGMAAMVGFIEAAPAEQSSVAVGATRIKAAFKAAQDIFDRVPKKTLDAKRILSSIMALEDRLNLDNGISYADKIDKIKKAIDDVKKLENTVAARDIILTLDNGEEVSALSIVKSLSSSLVQERLYLHQQHPLS